MKYIKIQQKNDNVPTRNKYIDEYMFVYAYVFFTKSFLHQNISSLHFLHAEDTLSLSLTHTHTHNIFTTGNIGVFRTEIHEIL